MIISASYYNHIERMSSSSLYIGTSVDRQPIEKWHSIHKLFNDHHIKRDDKGHITDVCQWCVIKTLGSGTYGTVYKIKESEDRKEEVVYALKVQKIRNLYKKGLDRSGLIEADLLHRINHPNIVRAIDIFFSCNDNIDLDQPALYMLMEYANNGNLRSYSKAINEKNAISCMKQLATGIAFLHKNGIIHCDMKPENVLMFDNVLKIADLGMATVMDGMKSSTLISTPSHEAPEVMMARMVFGYDLDFITPAIDVWAFGIMMYEVFCDRNMYLHEKIGKSDYWLLGNILTTFGLPIANEDYERFKLNDFAINKKREMQEIKEQFKYNVLDDRYDEANAFISLIDQIGLIKTTFNKSLIGTDASNIVPLGYPDEWRVKMTDHKQQLCMDLINKCLIGDNLSRITMNEVLKHPFFNSFEEINDVELGVMNDDAELGGVMKDDVEFGDFGTYIHNISQRITTFDESLLKIVNHSRFQFDATTIFVANSILMRAFDEMKKTNQYDSLRAKYDNAEWRLAALSLAYIIVRDNVMLRNITNIDDNSRIIRLHVIFCNLLSFYLYEGNQNTDVYIE